MKFEKVTTNIETWNSLCKDLQNKGAIVEDCEDYIEMRGKSGERIMTCILTGKKTNGGCVEVEIEAIKGLLAVVSDAE